LHQIDKVFHDSLQGWEDWLAEMIGGSQGRKLVKSAQFSVFLEARSFRGCPILTSCVSTLEPALSGVEGPLHASRCPPSVRYFEKWDAEREIFPRQAVYSLSFRQQYFSVKRSLRPKSPKNEN
jgi:hypothetical protein